VRVLTIAVVLLLAVAGAGCGGGDDEASDDTDTVTLETTTDETTTDETTDETTTEETTDGTTTGEVGDFLTGDCRELVEAGAALSQAFSAAGSDPDLEASGETFQAFADDAPEEIRADLQIMADFYDEYIAALRDAGLEAGETPSPEDIAAFQQALASINSAEFAAASARFSTWATANC
jgi:hypothetical protein